MYFFTCQAQKILPILSVFSWFLILGKIQDGGQDVDHVWRRHRPPAAPPPIKCTSSCREDQRLSNERKIFLKYCNHEPMFLLQHCMILRVRPRIKTHSRGITRGKCGVWVIYLPLQKLQGYLGEFERHGSQRRLKRYPDHRWCWLTHPNDFNNLGLAKPNLFVVSVDWRTLIRIAQAGRAQ